MLTDDQFRCRASQDLVAVCRDQGYQLDDEELDLVGRFDSSSLSPASEILDGGIKRC
jgi:hypothetical protein